MDSDRALGVLIIVGAIVAAILYFGSILMPWWSFLQAVQVLVSIAFLAILGIGGWIGWTMANTPSPEPVEDLDMEEIEEEAPEFEATEEDIGIPEDVEEQAQATKEFQEDLSSI